MTVDSPSSIETRPSPTVSMVASSSTLLWSASFVDLAVISAVAGTGLDGVLRALLAVIREGRAGTRDSEDALAP